MLNNKLSISFYTLGCKVNQYETQALKENFLNRGFHLVGEGEKADIYVINTCTVTNLADRKSRQYIRRMKKNNKHSVVAVIGCYAQISPEEVSGIPGVDLVLGNKEKNRLVDIVEELLAGETSEKGQNGPLVRVANIKEMSSYETSKITSFMAARRRAYLKVQDGCDRFCSYCIIPYARGPIKSRPLDEILDEGKNLVSKGFKELIITGINTALYGMEEEGASKIEDLVRALNDLEGNFRIRLGSLEPNVIDASLAKKLLKYEKLCPHMHLSIQSGSDKILRAMNRSYSIDEYLKIVEVLRDHDEFYGITTDIIVGFPGETEDDLKLSKEIIEKVNFVKTHVFPYSKRDGTEAATMKNHLSNKIKKERGRRLTEIASIASEEFLKSSLGQVREVLFEEYDEDRKVLTGYSDNYIKIYTPINEKNDIKGLLNELNMVEFQKLHDDGILGQLKLD